MVTFPKGNGPKIDDPSGGWSAMYFNECMNGFEYQVAGHMIWEGMLQEGLAITRAIHDRYQASRRNPWNEVECGDHYARSMASYAVFLAACGYEYHGPKGYLAFAPRIGPDQFRAPFTTAGGWGTFSQHRTDQAHNALIAVRWGRLKLKQLRLITRTDFHPEHIAAQLGGKPMNNARMLMSPQESTVDITFPEELTLEAGRELIVELK